MREITHQLRTRLRPISPTNKAISPNPLHRFSPARYPKMLANLS
jgi:hypothetical protein